MIETLPNIRFWRTYDDYLYRNEGLGAMMVSPATQRSLRHFKTHMLWEYTYGSRAMLLPYWDRPDFFRRGVSMDFANLSFSTPGITTPLGAATPGGRLSFRRVHRPLRVVQDDRELYHYNCQKLFALFLQFDTLIEPQIQAWTQMRHDEMKRALHTLWGANVLKRSVTDWALGDDLGPVWRINLYDNAPALYQANMDGLLRLLTTGDKDLENDERPPGYSSPYTIRHNLLAAESALRLSETCDNLAGFWGDSFASEDLFHVQDPEAKHRMSHGDMIAVTKNGGLVLFEFVRGRGNTRHAMEIITEKAASWIGVIATSDLDLSVIFLDAYPSVDRRAVNNAIIEGVQYRSAEYAPNKFMREMAMEKVGVASLSQWFPDDGCVSTAATRMAAWVPALKQYRCFDEPDSRFSTPQKRLDVLTNTVTALHTPPWMGNEIREKDARKPFNPDALKRTYESLHQPNTGDSEDADVSEAAARDE